MVSISQSRGEKTVSEGGTIIYMPPEDYNPNQKTRTSVKHDIYRYLEFSKIERQLINVKDIFIIIVIELMKEHTVRFKKHPSQSCGGRVEVENLSSLVFYVFSKTIKIKKLRQNDSVTGI